jgi:Protein of unknown function (DUF2891)
MTLTPDLASRFASLALGHVRREYPNKLDHVINDAGELRSPRELHPIFYGSFDWHSCVHGYWLLARVLRTADTLPEAARIRELFDAQVTAEKVAGEVAYLAQANRGTFERPYGWGWLLMLAAELTRFESPEGKRWAATFAPLADAFAAQFRAFLPKATYPIRSGAHYNTAFALALAFEYAQTADDPAFTALLRESATRWYGADENCQAWEPAGDDFLSPALIEAECMHRALGAHEFSIWFARFLPRIGAREPATLFTPATVSDRSDGKIGHLDGLNLTRAWCWRSIAASLDAGDARRELMEDSARRHIDASLPHISGDYMGEHWLATFALLALTSEK